MGRLIEKGKNALIATASGGMGFTLSGFLLRDWNFSWDWSVAAQPLATLGAGTAAIIAAAIALHNGEKTREQDKERTLRERFTSIVELLATDDLTKRESGAYALAALAGDWAAFYKDDPESALREQQVCLNILTGQLRDPILKDSPSELYTFKERIQDIIFTRFEEGNEKSSGQWSDLDLTLENCHFYNISSEGIFKNRVSFANSHFHGETNFSSSHFCDDTLFRGVNFYGCATFSKAHFNTETPYDPEDPYGKRADFSGVNFHERASFQEVKFHNRAVFKEAHFNSNTARHVDIGSYTHGRFSLAQFNGTTSFSKAQFNGTTLFSKAHFHICADFNRANFNESAWFGDAHFDAKTSFNNTQFKDETSFEGARFATTADFSNVKFKLPESHESNKIIKSLNTNLDNAEFGAEFPTG